MELYFCNILTCTRLYQFIALYDSIQKQKTQCHFFVLCMDNEVYRILEMMGLTNVTLYTLASLEDQRLLQLKAERTLDEYCWTLKPIFLQYVFDHHDKAGCLIYIDADTCFYDDPALIFEQQEDWSVLLSKHDFMDGIANIEKEVGKYNAGLVCFRRDPMGRMALDWWADRCVEWCKKTTITGQFGDQKYLEEMGNRFEGVRSIKRVGINTAPWNDGKYNLHSVEGKLFVDDHTLVLYHYCGFRVCSKQSCVFMFGNLLRPVIDKPYIKAIKEAIQKVETVEAAFDASFLEEENYGRFKTFTI